MVERQIPQHLTKVLELVCEGRRNRAIAEELGLAEHTVENYVSELLALFRVESRTELALAAQRRSE